MEAKLAVNSQTVKSQTSPAAMNIHKYVNPRSKIQVAELLGCLANAPHHGGRDHPLGSEHGGRPLKVRATRRGMGRRSLLVCVWSGALACEQPRLRNPQGTRERGDGPGAGPDHPLLPASDPAHIALGETRLVL